jgi:hypothetical protein
VTAYAVFFAPIRPVSQRRAVPEQPPLGKPIYDEPPAPDAEADQPREGEHVVVIPQTAGSAGAAHTEEG